MGPTGVSSSSEFAGSFAGSWRFFFYNSLMPKHRSWRRRSESNRRIQLLQSRALPLGYSAEWTGAAYSTPFATQAQLFRKLSAPVLEWDNLLPQHPRFSPSVLPVRLISIR